MEFFDQKIKDLSKKKKSEKTKNIYLISKKYLEAFGEDRKIKRGVSYRHVSDQFLEDFEQFLFIHCHKAAP